MLKDLRKSDTSTFILTHFGELPPSRSVFECEFQTQDKNSSIHTLEPGSSLLIDGFEHPFHILDIEPMNGSTELAPNADNKTIIKTFFSLGKDEKLHLGEYKGLVKASLLDVNSIKHSKTLFVENTQLAWVLHLLKKYPQLKQCSKDEKKLMVIIEVEEMFFYPRPSLFLTPQFPSDVIAAVPILEDLGIISRICHPSHPGCYDGDLLKYQNDRD